MKVIGKEESLVIIKEKMEIEKDTIFGLALVISCSPEEIAFINMEQYNHWLDNKSVYIYGCELWSLNELVQRGCLLKHYTYSENSISYNIDADFQYIIDNYLDNEEKWITVLFICPSKMKIDCKTYGLDSLEGLGDLRLTLTEYSMSNSDVFIFSRDTIDSNEYFFLHIRLA